MADVILFHHAQGLTSGVHAFADRLRAAGHRVTVPDLYAGRTFPTVDEGVAHAQSVGFETITAAGVAAAEGMPERAVYAGFSLGTIPAQKLAMTRPGALAAILYHGGVPSSNFGVPWPKDVPVQVHIAKDDPWGDPLEVYEELMSEAPLGELFLYPGSSHLFADNSVADYVAESAELALERSLALLSRLG